MKIYQYIKNKYGNWNLKRKMYSMFICGMLLYILVFWGYIQVVYHLDLKRKYVSDQERIVSEFAQSLHAEANIINNMSLSIIRNGAIRDYLNTPEPGQRLINIAQKELYQLIYTSESVESVYVIHTENQAISINYVGSDATRQAEFSAEWKKSLVDCNGGWMIGVNGNGAFQNVKYPVLSHMRAMYDLDTQKLNGYVIINLSMEFLEQQIRQFWQERDTFIGIYSQEYGMLVQKGNQKILEECFKNQNLESEDGIYTQMVGKYMIVQNVLENWGLEIDYISEVSFRKIFLDTFLWFGILILVVTSLFLFLLGKVMSITITSPIATLVRYMEKVQDGYLYRVSFKTNNDEIGILKESYNKMLVRINQLITDLVEEERKKIRWNWMCYRSKSIHIFFIILYLLLNI